MTKPSNVAPGVQSQQTAELRQQVNSQPMKPAVVIGKVTLPAARKPLPPRPPPTTVPGPGVKRSDRAKQMKRSDDNRAQVAGNQAMLQELQFIKGKLKAAETELATVKQNATFFRLQLKCLIEQVLAAGTSEGVTCITAEPSFQELVKYVGAEAPASGPKIVMAQTSLGPPVPMVPILVPLATLEKLAAQDDLVGKAIELEITAKAKP